MILQPPTLELEFEGGWILGSPFAVSPWAGYRKLRMQPAWGVVIHHAGGADGMGTVHWLAGPGADKREVGAHFVVHGEAERDPGGFTQLAPVHAEMWHATRANPYTIGIEQATPHGIWERAILELCVGLCEGLAEAGACLRYAVAHSAIQPGNRTDPGPGFEPGWEALEAMGWQCARTPQALAALKPPF